MVRYIIRLLADLVLIPIVVFCYVYHDEIRYGLAQGYGQLQVVISSRTVSDVLADPTFPDSLKQKLNFITEVRKYAVDSLGINESQNYTTVYDQRGKPVVWVVSASQPYELKPVQWSFPIAGSFPYKGFFNKAKAENLYKELLAKGYDADFGTVSGWSTLGWFKDPILSNMLYKSEGRLANLIIHELTHATLYVKSDADFNENLASFIGDKGAEKFLAFKFGNESQELNKYKNDKKDEEIFTNYILGAAENLEALYKGFKVNDSDSLKRKLKEERIIALVKGINTIGFTDQQRYSRVGESILKEKNAFFMQYRRYDSKKYFFENELNAKFAGNLKKYLTFLKEKYPSL